MCRTAVTVGLVTALTAGAAMAADIGPIPVPPQVGAYNWQGPYVGLNLGYQWGSVSNSSVRPAGVTGGAQAGYNWQLGAFVFGAEADIHGSDSNDVFATWKFSNPWFGTVRGRAGVALNHFLLYGTLGLAYGTLRAQSTFGGPAESKTGVGFAAGAGLEVAMMGSWTARAEYLYVDLGESAYAMTGLNHGISSSFVRLGVNYRF
jgi:outer membrane immunogenic protein